MDISPTIPIQPTPPVEARSNGQYAQTLNRAAEAKAPDPASDALKPLTPAPPLRPNVQDFVDIDRTLLMLRQGL